MNSSTQSSKIFASWRSVSVRRSGGIWCSISQSSSVTSHGRVFDSVLRCIQLGDPYNLRMLLLDWIDGRTVMMIASSRWITGVVHGEHVLRFSCPPSCCHFVFDFSVSQTSRRSSKRFCSFYVSASFSNCGAVYERLWVGGSRNLSSWGCSRISCCAPQSTR